MSAARHHSVSSETSEEDAEVARVTSRAAARATSAVAAAAPRSSSHDLYSVPTREELGIYAFPTDRLSRSGLAVTRRPASVAAINSKVARYEHPRVHTPVRTANTPLRFPKATVADPTVSASAKITEHVAAHHRLVAQRRRRAAATATPAHGRASSSAAPPTVRFAPDTVFPDEPAAEAGEDADAVGEERRSVTPSRASSGTPIGTREIRLIKRIPIMHKSANNDDFNYIRDVLVPSAPSLSEEAVHLLETDPVRFFARFKDGPIKYLYLRALNMDDTSQARGAFNPYVLGVISPDEAHGIHYTMSANGVTYVGPAGFSEFTPVSQWVHEREVFNVISQIDVFRQYRYWKPFKIWQSYVRHRRYSRNRRALSHRAVFLNPMFRDTARTIVRLSEQVMAVKFVRARMHASYTPNEFVEAQTSHRRHFKEQLGSVIDEMMRALETMARNVCDPARIEVSDEDLASHMRTNPSLRQILLMEKQKAHERARMAQVVNSEIRVIGNIVRLCDYLLIEALVFGVLASFKDLLTTMQTEKATLFRTELVMSKQHDIVFAPARDDMKSLINDALGDIVSQIASLPRPLTQPSLRKFLKLSGMDTRVLATQGPNLRAFLYHIVETGRTEEQIHGMIDRSYAAAERYANSFNEFKAVHAFSSEWSIDSYQDKPLDSFTNDWKRFSHWRASIDKMQTGSARGMLYIDSKALRAALLPIPINAISDLKSLLISQARDGTNKLHEQFRSKIKSLSAPAQTLDEFVAFVEIVRQTGRDLTLFMSEAQRLDDMYMLLDDQDVEVPSADVNRHSLIHSTFARFRDHIAQARARMETLLPTYQNQLEKSINSSNASLAKTMRSMETGAFILPDSVPAVLLSQLATLRTEVQEQVSKARAFAQYQQVLEVGVDPLHAVATIEAVLEYSEALWTVVQQWNSHTRMYMSQPFLSLRSDELAEAIQSTNNQIIELAERRPHPITSHVRRQVDQYMQLLPNIRLLHESQLQSRHWEQLFSSVGLSYLDRKAFSLHDLMESGALEATDEISQLAAIAKGEALIESRLHDVREQWARATFDFAHATGTETDSDVASLIPQSLRITNLAKLRSMMAEHQVVLMQLRSSPFYRGLRTEIESFTGNLLRADAVLQLLLSCDQHWPRLQAVFSVEDVLRLLEPLQSPYRAVARRWRNALRSIKKDVSIMKHLHAKESLEAVHQSMISVLSLLDAWLDSKRDAFPRFHLLANSELLSFLSNASQLDHRFLKNPQLLLELWPVLGKMWPNLATLEHAVAPSGSHLIWTGMVSREREVVPFNNPIGAEGEAESWLARIAPVSRSSLQQALTEALLGYTLPMKLTWLWHFPVQVILLASSIAWTRDVEAALGSPDVVSGLQQLEKGMRSNIAALTKLQGQGYQLSDLRIALIESLLGDELHRRDQVRRLIEQASASMSGSPSTWSQHVRWYYEREFNACTVRIGTASLTHSFDYIGAAPRGIIVPSSERALAAVIGAVAARSGVMVTSNAGGGKHSLIADLGAALGRWVIDLELWRMDAAKLMAYCKAAFHIGPWVVLQALHLLSPELQSMLAHVVARVTASLTQRTRTIDFAGTERQLADTIAWFATSNPIGLQEHACAGRVSSVLLSQFRTVALPSPSRGVAAQTLLYSSGFQAYKELAGRLTWVLDQLAHQCSAQPHYSFLSFRMLTTIIRLAGSLKRQPDHAHTDAELLGRTLRDVVASSLVPDDRAILTRLLSDAFPSTVLPDVDYQPMRQRILSRMQSAGLHASDAAVASVLRLYEALLVHSGVIVVGPQGCGKSATIAILAAVLQDINDAAITMYPRSQAPATVSVAPDSYTDDELWGTATTPGLLPEILRAARQRTWLLMDALPTDQRDLETWLGALMRNTGTRAASGLMLPSHEMLVRHPLVEVIVEATPEEIHSSGLSSSMLGRVGIIYVDADVPRHWQQITKMRVAQLQREYRLSVPVTDDLAQHLVEGVVSLAEAVAQADAALTDVSLDVAGAESVIDPSSGTTSSVHTAKVGAGASHNEDAPKASADACSGSLSERSSSSSSSSTRTTTSSRSGGSDAVHLDLDQPTVRKQLYRHATTACAYLDAALHDLANHATSSVQLSVQDDEQEDNPDVLAIVQRAMAWALLWSGIAVVEVAASPALPSSRTSSTALSTKLSAASAAGDRQRILDIADAWFRQRYAVLLESACTQSEPWPSVLYQSVALPKAGSPAWSVSDLHLNPSVSRTEYCVWVAPSLAQLASHSSLSIHSKPPFAGTWHCDIAGRCLVPVREVHHSAYVARILWQRHPSVRLSALGRQSAKTMTALELLQQQRTDAFIALINVDGDRNGARDARQHISHNTSKITRHILGPKNSTQWAGIALDGCISQASRRSLIASLAPMVPPALAQATCSAGAAAPVLEDGGLHTGGWWKVNQDGDAMSTEHVNTCSLHMLCVSDVRDPLQPPLRSLHSWIPSPVLPISTGSARSILVCTVSAVLAFLEASDVTAVVADVLCTAYTTFAQSSESLDVLKLFTNSLEAFWARPKSQPGTVRDPEWFARLWFSRMMQLAPGTHVHDVEGILTRVLANKVPRWRTAGNEMIAVALPAPRELPRSHLDGYLSELIGRNLESRILPKQLAAATVATQHVEHSRVASVLILRDRAGSCGTGRTIAKLAARVHQREFVGIITSEGYDEAAALATVQKALHQAAINSTSMLLFIQLPAHRTGCTDALSVLGEAVARAVRSIFSGMINIHACFDHPLSQETPSEFLADARAALACTSDLDACCIVAARTTANLAVVVECDDDASDTDPWLRLHASQGLIDLAEAQSLPALRERAVHELALTRVSAVAPIIKDAVVKNVLPAIVQLSRPARTVSYHNALVRDYVARYSEERSGLSERIAQLDTAIDMVASLRTLQATMRAKRETLQPIMADTVGESERLVAEISAVRREHEAAAAEAHTLSEEMTVCDNEFSHLTEVIDMHRSEVDPAFNDATRWITELTSQEAAHLVAFGGSPPDAQLVKVMEALCILLDRSPVSWESGLAVVAGGRDELEAQLVNLDLDQVPESVCIRLRKYLINPDFTPEHLSQFSTVAAAVCAWIDAAVKKIAKIETISPMQRSLGQCDNRRVILRSNLAAARKRIKTAELQLWQLEENLKQSETVRKDLVADPALDDQRMSRIDRLLAAVSTVFEDWTQERERLQRRLEHLPGDALLAACVMSFQGDATSEERAASITHWITLLQEAEVPVTPDWSVLDIIDEPFVSPQDALRSWERSEALPSSHSAHEAAVLVRYTPRWPMIIDPDSMLDQWLIESLTNVSSGSPNIDAPGKTRRGSTAGLGRSAAGSGVGKRSLTVDRAAPVVMTPSTPHFLTVLAKAVSHGNSVILQHAELMSPEQARELLPMSVLAHTPVQRGGRWFALWPRACSVSTSTRRANVNANASSDSISSSEDSGPGDNDQHWVPWHTSFSLTIVMREPQPELQDMLSCYTTLVSVPHDPVVLSERLLDLAQQQDKPELVQRRDRVRDKLVRACGNLVRARTGMMQQLGKARDSAADNLALIEQVEDLWNTVQEDAAMHAERLETLADLDTQREKLRPVAACALGIMQLAIRLRTLNPSVYVWHVPDLVAVFRSALAAPAESVGLAKSKVQSQQRSVTLALFDHLAGGMLVEHRLLLAFLVAVEDVKVSLADPNAISSDEWSLFISGSDCPAVRANALRSASGIGQAAKSDDLGSDGVGSNPPDWLDSATWAALALIPHGVRADIAANPQTWREYAFGPASYKAALPGTWDGRLTEFQRVTLLRLLNPSATSLAMREFVRRHLGARFLETPPLSIERIHQDVSARQPALLLVPLRQRSPLDVLDELMRVARDMNLSQRVQQLDVPLAVATAQAAGQDAMVCVSDRIASCAARGQWLLVTGLEANAEHARVITGMLLRYSEQVNRVDEDFRVWIIAGTAAGEALPLVPPLLLQMSHTQYVQAPVGVKSLMTQLYSTFSDSLYQKSRNPKPFRKVLFGVSFLHAQLLERLQYVPQGWAQAQMFPMHAFNSSLAALRAQMDTQVSVSFDVVRNTLHGLYTSHMTDPTDMAVFAELMRRVINNDLLSEKHALTSSGVYHAPADGPLEVHRNYIGFLPSFDWPEAVGMHDANKWHASAQQSDAFAALLRRMFRVRELPRSLSRINENRATAWRLLERLPSRITVRADVASSEDSPVGALVRAECCQLNALRDMMHADVYFIASGTGPIAQSSTATALMQGVIPKAWAAAVFPGLDPGTATLDALLTGLGQRVDYFRNWIGHANNAPANVWIGAFYRPASLIALAHLLRPRVDLDYSKALLKPYLSYSVTDRHDTHQLLPPTDGWYLTRMRICGAIWTPAGLQNETHATAATERSHAMPVIHVRVAEEEPPAHLFVCPVYQTFGSQRRLVARIPLPCNELIEVLLLNGVHAVIT